MVVLDGCTSTIDVGQEFADSGASHGLTVIASEQSAGRGRFGRAWLSPKGGLWMTIVLRSPGLSTIIDGLTLIGALSTARALSHSLGLKALVKWPNDVVVHSDKIAGILAESRFRGNECIFALLGIGVNANFEATLLRSINQKSTTILSELDRRVDVNDLACAILEETEAMLDLASSNQNDILDLLRKQDYSLNKKVMIEAGGHAIRGTFHDYESLAEVGVDTDDEYVIVETATVTTVEYVQDKP